MLLLILPTALGFALDVGYLVMLRAGLPSNVRSRSGQPCSLCRAGDLCVLRPARRIHIRRRGRVLHNSPPPASVRSAAAPTVTAHGTSGRVRRAASRLGLAPAPRAVSPGVFTALRAAMLRRRNTAFSPCDVYHRASAEPSRCVSLSSPLGTPLRFLTTC